MWFTLSCLFWFHAQYKLVNSLLGEWPGPILGSWVRHRTLLPYEGGENIMPGSQPLCNLGSSQFKIVRLVQEKRHILPKLRTTFSYGLHVHAPLKVPVLLFGSSIPRDFHARNMNFIEREALIFTSSWLQVNWLPKPEYFSRFFTYLQLC